MNVLIIHFSQSGNTAQIAGAISDGIIKSGNCAGIMPMKSAPRDCPDGYDLIGIGTPTFFYQEPKNVKDFIQNMNRTQGRHCFLFCTHGSVMGNTIANMSTALFNRGYTIVGAFDCYASSSVQFYPSVMHTEGHPDSIDIENARRFGEGICSQSERIRKGEKELLPAFEVVEDACSRRIF